VLVLRERKIAKHSTGEPVGGAGGCQKPHTAGYSRSTAQRSTGLESDTKALLC
jgi:hypothetical protein